MIKGIYIENFKGIGEPGIKLDLEPVTLLFGSNSAGKSSVFHAILLAYEILVRGNRNPDRTELGGSVIDLGGFRRFIHQQQMHRSVRLRFELDLASVSLDQQWPIPERLIEIKSFSPNSTKIDLTKIGEDIWSASVEISIMWDEIIGQPFVAEYAVNLDGQRLASITDRRASGDGPGLIVDPSHPAFAWPEGLATGGLGILDDLDPRFRTMLQDLFFGAEPVDVSDTDDILEDREEWQDWESDDDISDAKWDAIEDRVMEEDEWEIEEYERSQGHFDDESDGSEELHTDTDDEPDDDHDETEDLQGTTIVSRGGFVVEMELMSRLLEAGEVEIRRIVISHPDGREVEPFLYRIQPDGLIGVWAVYFPANDGWLRPEADKFLEEWRSTLGVSPEGEDHGWMPLQLDKLSDALPSFREPLVIKRASTEAEEETKPVDDQFLCQLLSRLILVPGQVLVQSLDLSRYIGPLRQIPQRQFVSPTTPDPSRWSTGLAAWDYLNQCPDEVVDEISHWLADDTRLGTRHEIFRQRFRELLSDSFEISKLESDDYLDELERIRNSILSRKEISRIQLHDQTLDVKIDPHDCAIGIAQLVPVVVAGVMSRKESEKRGMFLIEQPELHNHPSVEVGLGDLFVETIHQKHCRFILETHGEHLMLRMLRRIREMSEGELPEGVTGLLPEELAVYVIERTPAGVSAKRLRISETGDFIDKWPNGFFRERSKELF